MMSDFFLEEADAWRDEAWDIIRKRPGICFSLLTKRANRIRDHLPEDWGDGWDNVTFAVSCENQANLDERMPYLLELPLKHCWISLKPFIGPVDLSACLESGKVEWVLAGGENYLGQRPLHYEWVQKVYDDCLRYGVRFTFSHIGNVFIKDGKEYRVKSRTEQTIQAIRSGLNIPPLDIEKEVAEVLKEKELKQAGNKNIV